MSWSACRAPEPDGERGSPCAEHVDPPAICEAGYISMFAGAESCAVCSTGRVDCWGEGAAPHVIAGLDDAVEVSGNLYLACARTRRGTVSCWGKLANVGLIGDDRGIAEIVLPGRAIQIAVGSWHACALLEDRAVACWGLNDWLQLGTLEVGTGRVGAVPPRIVPELRASALSANGNVTCVVETDGHAACFGFNGHGALGVGDRASTHYGPVRPQGLDRVIDIATDGVRACARRGDGSVWCWGDEWAWDDPDEPPAPLAPRRLPTGCPAGALEVVTNFFGAGSPPTGVAVATPPLRAISWPDADGCSLDDSGRLRCWGTPARVQPALAGAKPQICLDRRGSSRSR